MVALVLAVALPPTGCGRSADASAEDWAANLCGSLSAWVTEVDSAQQTLSDKGLNLSERDVRTAVERAADASDELLADLKELGPPGTKARRQVEAELDELESALRDQVETVEEELRAGFEPLYYAGFIAVTLSPAAHGLEETLQNLELLDPGGELEQALRDSEDCVALREMWADNHRP